MGQRVGDVWRLPVPVTAHGRAWATVEPDRLVLGVVHNITSATRLLDLLSVFEGDDRVQVVFTCTRSSALDSGVPEFFEARGMLYLPWSEALSGDFDLAIATSRGGDLHEIPFPLIGTPHGAGYNKILSRKQKAESRKQKAESRKPEAFGLSEDWLLHDGELIPSAIVLSHEEQLERLKLSCPKAAPAAVIAGDPCLDQLRAGLPFRSDYREALGISPWQKLVVVSSTWGRDSLLGSPAKDIIRRTLAELPADEFRVAVAVHPNAWFGHGAWQVQHWLAPLLDSGLLLPAPETDVWKALLCSADLLIGDDGSVTLYGMALGLPVALGAFAHARVADDSPMARLGRLAPHLSALRPLPPQLRAVADSGAVQELAGLVTSRPGESKALLRELFYTRLKLPEPDPPAVTREVPLPSPPRQPRTTPVLPARYCTVSHSPAGDAVVRRYPAALQRAETSHLAGAHLTADPDDPAVHWPRTADVLLIPRSRTPRHQALRARFPGHGLAACEEPDDGCLALLPDGTRLRAHWPTRPPWASFSLAASVLYDHMAMSRATEPHTQVRIQVRVSEDTEPALLVVTRA